MQFSIIVFLKVDLVDHEVQRAIVFVDAAHLERLRKTVCEYITRLVIVHQEPILSVELERLTVSWQRELRTAVAKRHAVVIVRTDGLTSKV